MNRSEAFNQKKGFTPADALQSLERTLNFDEWPLRAQTFVPGFSPSVSRLPFRLLEGFTLEHETLLPVVSTWVGRNYFYSQLDSHSAFALTVLVGQQSARDVAEALLLQIVYSQMSSEPRVEFNGLIGDVAVYRHPEPNASVAFVRNNIGINLENYSSNGNKLNLGLLAASVDDALKEMPTVPYLAEHENRPRILRLQAQDKSVHPGEKIDLDIDIRDNYPPLHLLFNATMGSYNQDPRKNDVWYFRAGFERGEARVDLTVVNEMNLMDQASCRIVVE